MIAQQSAPSSPLSVGTAAFGRLSARKVIWLATVLAVTGGVGRSNL
jgi:hypothetical protein